MEKINVSSFSFVICIEYLGSPLEERKRLVKYLAEIKHTSINCDKVEYNENDVPLLCKLEIKANACIVVYVRYELL